MSAQYVKSCGQIVTLKCGYRDKTKGDIGEMQSAERRQNWDSEGLDGG